MAKGGKSENVQVIVRVRPLNKKELAAGHHCVVNPDIANNCVYVDEAGVDGRAWSFDGVYTNAFSQRDVYNQSIRPLVESVLAGFNGTIFAYGQSGTGKTYSMAGDLSDKSKYGIIPNALDHIFTQIEETKTDNLEFRVKATYVELYNGKCRDLLVDGQLNLELKENAQKLFFVKDLSEWEISSTKQAMDLMEQGLERREVKATDLNADSSRSHSLFTVIVKVWDKEQDVRTESKLNLVDLAGSERQSKTGATGDTLKEGNAINLSLTALGTVIDCLVKQKPHIPYRSTQLTMLLKDGLGGNSRTVIVGAIGPADHNAHETVSTLRFIDRAKQIKNKPKVQMDPKDAKIAELTELVKKLKRQLGLDSADEGEEGGDDDSKKKKPVLLDDEIERLKQRIEELELELQTTRNASQAVEQLQRELEVKSTQLEKHYKEKEDKLHSEISDLRDRYLLHNDGDDAKYQSLLALCVSFLQEADTKGEWAATVNRAPPATGSSTIVDGLCKDAPEPGSLLPTFDDISQGFRMVKVSGAEMRSFVIRKHSMVPGGTVSPVKEPRPPADAKGQHGATFVRSTSPGMSGPSDEEFPSKDKKSKDTKKEKKVKKSKKDKEGMAGAAIDAALPDATIDVAVKNFPGISQAQVADVKAAVCELLAQQRADMLSAFQQRAATVATEQEGSSASAEETAELLAAMEQLKEEVSVLRQGSRKQQAAVEKARAMADKKISEVTSLKEHIDALREELSTKHTQHASEMALHEEQLIQQFNKKTEQMLAKQSKAHKQDRKNREVLERKIQTLEERNADVERDYDTKVMEYETLLRDFEEVKFEQMKRLKNTFVDERAITSRGNAPVPVALSKLNSNVPGKLAELPDKNPRSAPELPALGALRRPPSGIQSTTGFSRSPLDNPRVLL